MIAAKSAMEAALLASVCEFPGDVSLRLIFADWLTSDDPAAMLAWIRETGGESSNRPRNPPSDRKQRLFSCACCRQVWVRLDDDGRRSVEVAERYADGNEVPLLDTNDAVSLTDAEWGARLVASGSVKTCEAATRADILRDIFGNPWRPVRLDTTRPACPHCRSTRFIAISVDEMACLACFKRFCWSNDWCKCPWLTWSNDLIPTMARHIYDDRAWGELPILADALEEAGCAEEEILRHCRQPGLHARGCWVIDLLLGKE
jgi:uncharacterized protein (TIGR02996 family)